MLAGRSDIAMSRLPMFTEVLLAGPALLQLQNDAAVQLRLLTEQFSPWDLVLMLNASMSIGFKTKSYLCSVQELVVVGRIVNYTKGLWVCYIKRGPTPKVKHIPACEYESLPFDRYRSRH